MNPQKSPLESGCCRYCGAEGANFDPDRHAPECKWAQARDMHLKNVSALIAELTRYRNYAYEQHVRALDVAIRHLQEHVL